MSVTARSKSPTKPEAGSIAAHRKREAEAASEYAAARAAANAAAVTIPEREAAAEAAEEHVEDIRASWANGYDQYTADDLSRAQAEAERAKALLAGARSTVAREERAAKSTDTDVAAIVAAAINDVLDWVPTVPTFLPPIPADGDETAIYVVQSEPTTRNKLGTLSGKVEVAAYLDRRYRPLTGDAIDQALTRRGQRARVVPSPLGICVPSGEVERSHWRITVEEGHDELPVIAHEPTEATAREFGVLVFSHAGRKDFTGSVTSPTVTYVEENGTRATTVTALIVGHFFSERHADRYAAGSPLWETPRPSRGAIFGGAESALAGQFVPGLGLVTSLAIEPAPEAGAAHQTGWRITGRFTSRTPAA